MITLAQYWMGRDLTHIGEWSPAVREHATELLARVNALLDNAAMAGVYPGLDERTGTAVASGWRPRGVNARTANAATASRHIAGQAIDVEDTPPERPLARFCLQRLDLLEELDLWLEDPRWTPTWVHLQSVPPGSGRRVFIPSARPPLAAAQGWW